MWWLVCSECWRECSFREGIEEEEEEGGGECDGE